MDEDKSLEEFLYVLYGMTEANIDFLKKKEAKKTKLCIKYQSEMKKIQEVINSFDFIREENE